MRAKLDLVKRLEDMPEGTEFGIRITGDELAPIFKAGDTVYAKRRGRMAAGDVGLFLVEGELLCRQYAEDSEGNIYLFALDRAKRSDDLVIPPTTPVTLYAKLLLPEPIPLPGIEP